MSDFVGNHYKLYDNFGGLGHLWTVEIRQEALATNLKWST